MYRIIYIMPPFICFLVLFHSFLALLLQPEMQHKLHKDKCKVGDWFGPRGPTPGTRAVAAVRPWAGARTWTMM